MQTRTLHSIFAYLALIFLSWPCFRPFEASLTYGDMFLGLAALMNVQHMSKIRPYQVLLLLALPTLMVSQVFDPDGSPEAIIQAAYIFGFVLPFGWLAFAGLPVHRIVSVLLLAEGISSMVALGQTFGYLDAFGKARVWNTLDAYRAAGFNTSCSGLCMNLTSLFCLLLYLRDQRLRVVLLSLLLIGISATMAKSSTFAVPAIAFYLYWEPHRWKVIGRFAVLATLIVGVIAVTPALQDKLIKMSASLSRRADGLDYSMNERLSTLKFALDFVPECYFFGLGYEGTARTLTPHLGNTVHVFHIGIILIGGMIGALFHYGGFALMLRDAAKFKQYPLIMMVLSHWLSVCTMPVLMLSNQYIPLIVCGTILFAVSEQEEQQKQQAAREAQQQAAANRRLKRKPIVGAFPAPTPAVMNRTAGAT